jgi:hypothetical protein
VHELLRAVCPRLAGADMSPQGLAILEQWGLHSLYQANLLDAESVASVFDELNWVPQVLLVGELLGQVDAPGQLLRNCTAHMTEDTSLLLTAPNALALKLVLRGILGYEKLNPRHSSYFSYSNLRGLLSRHGLEMVDVGYYVAHTRYRWEMLFDWFLRPLLRLRPHLADGLIVGCRVTCAPAVEYVDEALATGPLA